MSQTFNASHGRAVVFLGVALVGAALIVPTARSANSGPAAAPGFRVEIDGATIDGVREISGIDTEIEVIEYRDGGDLVTRKRPGRVKYGTINVKRVVVKADKLAEWFEKTRGGTTERKSGSVIYLDRAGAEVLRYNFFEAWPCRWSGPELDADHKDPQPVEAISLCVERIDRVAR